MQKIKGESSYWINKNKLTCNKFEWQDDYYAVSVGLNHLSNLRSYIRNQGRHHLHITFQTEFDKLLEGYKLERIWD